MPYHGPASTLDDSTPTNNSSRDFTNIHENVNTGYNDQYNELESSQQNILYYFDNADGSGYVFELAELDEDNLFMTIDPSFVADISGFQGLRDCSATVQFDVSLSKFQGLFSVQMNSEHSTNIFNEEGVLEAVQSDSIVFKVNAVGDQSYNDISDSTNNKRSNLVGSLFTGLAFGSGEVRSGNMNYSSTNQKIKHDFIRHLAYQITGGYSSSDIFTNETALRNNVDSLDSQIDASLNQVLSDLSQNWQPPSYDDRTQPGASLIQAARQLFRLNFQTSERTGPLSIQRDNAGTSEGCSRADSLVADIIQAAENMKEFITVDGTQQVAVGELNVPLRFHHNDRIAVRVTYNPASSVFPGNQASLGPRSYKILLRLIDDLDAAALRVPYVTPNE